MTKELTTEESDKLILEELNIESDNTINAEAEEVETIDEVEETETIDEVNEETEELEETETEEASEVEEEPETTKQKKPNKFAKLLSQRNEARKQAEEAKTVSEELQVKLDKMEEDGDYGNEEYINTLVEKRMEEANSKQDDINDFFIESDLGEFRKDILKIKRETGLSIERASAVYLAENKPELLLSSQAKAKNKAQIFNTPGRASVKLKTGKLTYSDDEFETMAAKGLINF